MQPLPDAFAELDFTHDWTLAGSLEFTGHGVHTGAATRLILHPATSAGLILRHQGQEIPIQVSDVRDTRFCTTISGVMTLEHVLAALNGLGISAAVIEVAGPEAPILDGSAGPIVAAVLAAGIVSLASRRRIYRLTRPWRWQHGEIRIDAEPARQLEIAYAIDFQRSESRLQQELGFSWSPAAFAAEIAPARTFAFAADVEAMRAQGLVRGGSLENALVLDEQARALNGLRFGDEPVRHKILDCLGDLALLGGWLQARLRIERGGHSAHVTMVKTLKGQGLLADERKS